MKLIFNKNDEGLKEMQKCFSRIPGTLDFSDFEEDLTAAQEEVAKYIGETLLNLAIDHYWAVDAQAQASGSGSGSEVQITQEDKTELVKRIQVAVTLMGYRDFAQNNDATHTSTGRTARSDKDSDVLNLKLIEQDDLALQRKGLKAMDRLIKYVDDKKFPQWTGSAIYKETKELLIWNADTFDNYFPIERNRRIFLLLVPMIRKAQMEQIMPRLGKDLYGQLMEKVKTNKVESMEDKYLYALCASAVAELAMSEAYAKLPTQLFTENMTRQLWNAGNGAAALVLREKLVEDIAAMGQKSLEKLEAELEARSAKDSGEQITDESIVDIADRMDAGNLFARV